MKIIHFNLRLNYVKIYKIKYNFIIGFKSCFIMHLCKHKFFTVVRETNDLI